MLSTDFRSPCEIIPPAALYRIRMPPTQRTKTVLWANLSTLMARQWGGENLSRLARETGIGPGGATRLKNPDPEASVRVAMLESLAELFDVEPWQLLAPDLGEDLYTLGDDRRLAPVYRPAAMPNVVQLPETPSGGVHKTRAQKDRLGHQTKPKNRAG